MCNVSKVFNKLIIINIIQGEKYRNEIKKKASYKAVTKLETQLAKNCKKK